MVHHNGYKPAYYSSLQDTITSLCRSWLPLPTAAAGLRRLPSAEQTLAHRHSESLKWQQESFHRILQLIGLNKEGIVPKSEVTAFRSRLLDTLIAAPVDPEPPNIVRDKLIFLQELFYAKCISEDEYHSSRMPLVRRLAAQEGEEGIGLRDTSASSVDDQEEWSVIDLKDEDECMPMASSKKKSRTPFKNLLFSNIARRGGSVDDDDPAANRAPMRLMAESSPPRPLTGKKKNKVAAFRGLFNLRDDDAEHMRRDGDQQHWGFSALKRLKKSGGAGADDASLRKEEFKGAAAAAAVEATACTTSHKLVALELQEEGKQKCCYNENFNPNFFSSSRCGEETQL